MKISRTPSSLSSNASRRRRNPLVLPVLILILIFAGLLAWFWARGGEKPQAPVEKAIPAERLGH